MSVVINLVLRNKSIWDMRLCHGDRFRTRTYIGVQLKMIYYQQLKITIYIHVYIYIYIYIYIAMEISTHEEGPS